jgi:hypothetical protein
MKNNRHLVLASLTLVFMMVIAACILLFFHSRSDKSVVAVRPTAYNSSENKRLLKITPQRKVLLFSFILDHNNKKLFTLSDIGEYNGVPETPGISKADYSFSVIENGNPRYTTNFSIKTVNIEKFNKDGTIERVNSSDKQDTYTIRTPRFKDGSTYIIRNSNGRILLEGKVDDIKKNNNKPSYKTFITD